MTLRETGPAVARVVWWRSPFHLDDVRRTVLEMEGQRHCCEREGAAAAWLFMLHGMRKVDGARSIRDSIHVGRKMRSRHLVESRGDAERGGHQTSRGLASRCCAVFVVGDFT
jgi:hypothetical protein